MDDDAKRLMAEALKHAKLDGSFSPEELGANIGLTKLKAEVAARTLSNAGVLVLGFDCAAHFSPEYRKAHTPVVAKPKTRRKKPVSPATT